MGTCGSSCPLASRAVGHALLPFAEMRLLGWQEGRGAGWGGKASLRFFAKSVHVGLSAGEHLPKPRNLS